MDAVGVTAGGFGKTCHIEPVLAPMLAEAWRLEQRVHECCDGGLIQLGPDLPLPVLHHVRSRRQPAKREEQAPHEHAWFRCFGR